jgi:hypothetical protein
MALFLDSERAALAVRNVPRQVASISNHKMLGQSTYIAQVGGGVTIEPVGMLLEASYAKDAGGKLDATRDASVAQKKSAEHPWWWD